MIFDEKLNFKGQEKLFSKQTLLILIYLIKIFLLPFSELKNSISIRSYKWKTWPN